MDGQVDQNQAVEEVTEENRWKVSILGFVQQFVTTTEHNFRGLWQQGEKILPLPASKGFLVERFCDGLTGIYVALIANHVGDSIGVEEATVKAVRTKFAHFKAHKLRRKIMGAGDPNKIFSS